MRIIVMILLALTMLITACAVEKINQVSSSKADYGQLMLTGNLANKQVLLNNERFKVDELKTKNIVELKSGMYNLEIQSSGKTLLSQKILISNSQTTEVRVP